MREYSRKPLGFADSREDEASGFLESHVLVIVLQTEHGMLKERHTVEIPLQEHRQVSVDICLSEIVRQFLKIQHSLRNLQAVRIDSIVCVLSKTEFLSKERNAVPEFRHNLYRLVHDSVGHGVLWCRGLMTGGLE